MERSAGVVVYRRGAGEVESAVDGAVDGAVRVLLGHLGGPFWSRRDDGAWTIPKGLVEPGEDDRDAACREFAEETGHAVPDGEMLDLGISRQHRGKEIHIWAVAGDLDAAACSSNTFELEWPPRSGTVREFPELDRFAWFDLATAAERIVQGQRPVLHTLATVLSAVADDGR